MQNEAEDSKGEDGTKEKVEDVENAGGES